MVEAAVKKVEGKIVISGLDLRSMLVRWPGSLSASGVMSLTCQIGQSIGT